MNNFYNIYSEITFQTNLIPLAKQSYQHYFSLKVEDQDKLWLPQICCNSCSFILREWLKNKTQFMAFEVPMVWRKPTNHTDD